MSAILRAVTAAAMLLAAPAAFAQSSSMQQPQGTTSGPAAQGTPKAPNDSKQTLGNSTSAGSQAVPGKAGGKSGPAPASHPAPGAKSK